MCYVLCAMYIKPKEVNILHALEKILARCAGVPAVRAGEIVNAKVDLAEIGRASCRERV